MKPEINWMEQNNLSLLPHQELDWVEYKGRKSIDLTLGINENNVKNLLSKAISAFANTGGGYLVLGINDDTFSIDDGGIDVHIKENGTRAWLEDILPTLCDPSLKSFNVIEKTGRDLDENIIDGRAIYIIDIPDSDSAPHQAHDNKYYGRIGGKSRPLSHKFILDILNRRVDPEIKLLFTLVTENSKLFLQIIMMNVGRVMANHVKGWVYIPKNLVPENTEFEGNIREIDRILYYAKAFDNLTVDITGFSVDGENSYGIKRNVPILRGLNFYIMQELKKRPFELNFPFVGGVKVVWEYAFDNVPIQEGEIEFSQIRKQSKKYNLD